ARNRARPCVKAGAEPRYLSIEFDDHDAAVAYVISKNIRRRHLTHEQKREVIEKLLRTDPTKSDRQIARPRPTTRQSPRCGRRQKHVRRFLMSQGELTAKGV